MGRALVRMRRAPIRVVFAVGADTSVRCEFDLETGKHQGQSVILLKPAHRTKCARIRPLIDSTAYPRYSDIDLKAMWIKVLSLLIKETLNHLVTAKDVLPSVFRIMFIIPG